MTPLHSISDLKATISYTVSESWARSQCRIGEKPVSARRKSGDARLRKLRGESWHGHCHFPARRVHEEVIRNHSGGGDFRSHGSAQFRARSELPLEFNLSAISNAS